MNISLNLEIGSLHCAFKHLCSAYEVIFEIIEKLIREKRLDTVLVLLKARTVTSIIIHDLLDVIKGRNTSDTQDIIMAIIDTIRKIRGTLCNTLYGLECSRATEVEFIKAIGMLYNAELHLGDYLMELLAMKVKEYARANKSTLERRKEEEKASEASAKE